MSNAPLRVNPRRPFHITPNGRKRIVLGESGEGAVGATAPVHASAPKPKRLSHAPTHHILVIVHTDRGALDAHAHQAIAAASILADGSTGVMVLILGDLSEDLAAAGADRVIVVPECGNGGFAPDLELSVASDIIARFAPRHILLPDNAIGDGDLGRRIAAELGLEIAAHVVELKHHAVAVYLKGGSFVARRALPRVILLDPDIVDGSLPYVGDGERIDYAAHAVAPGAYLDLGESAIKASQLALEEADFIVSAGNGVHDVPTVEAVAETFGAAIGASRVAVDDGKFARDKQIGATGKTVQASVYMAIGISGAVQHLQGIRACRHVIAINQDASAPIAKRADLTIVDDAQAVMQALLLATAGRNWSADEAELE